MTSDNPYAETERVFDDGALIDYLETLKIPYSLDDEEMVHVLPDKRGKKQPIIVSDTYSRVDLKNLRSSGSFSSGRCPNVALGALKDIDGNLDMEEAVNADVSALETVSRSIWAPELLELSAPSLQEVGLNVRLGKAESVKADAVTCIGGSLSAPDAENLSLHSLEEVGVNMNTWSDAAPDLSSLRKVGGEITLHPNAETPNMPDRIIQNMADIMDTSFHMSTSKIAPRKVVNGRLVHL